MRYVTDYIQRYRNGEIKLNKKRIQLIQYIESVVLKHPGVYFDEQQINDFVNLSEKYFFNLEPFQKFLVSFVFFYHADGRTVFDRFFWTMARGAGKNGLISALCFYFISQLYGVKNYNVAIVANSEDQAKTSFMEVHNMLNAHPQLGGTFDKNLRRKKGPFKNGLSKITSNLTYSTLEYLTSNANTKDSYRHGVVIFDEIHQYENYDIIDVLTDGLGKVQPPRAFFISTDGFVREGVYDKEYKKASEILQDTELKSKTFPWICELDGIEQVDDETDWQMANPMFHEPMSDYARGLFNTVRDQYGEVLRGERDKAKWLIKRMNYSGGQMESSVASREDIMATNQEVPMLDNEVCVGGLDYASMRDFASVGCLFYLDGKYIWKTHSFVRKGFLLNEPLAISPMIPEWQEKGLLTVVDRPTIEISYIVDWFVEMREVYGLNTIIGDSYRIDLVRPALEAEGFNVEFIRRSSAIEAKIAPEIEMLFAEHRLIYGDNPLMRWFTNNVYVTRDKFGNMRYEKKDEKKRKTDGFMAFVHAFWKANELLIEAEPDDFMFDDWY